MSKLTKALAVVSILAPASAQPLGIGDIELHSSLNQKLNAEIRLHLAAGENPSDISVRLAPPDKFDQAGVAWNYFLSKIKFEPVVQSNGTVLVKITSKETLTEPFLNFLLEVSWPQGNLFREFTLLIDPPAEYSPPAIPSAGERGYSVEPLAADMDRPVRKARSSSRRSTTRTSSQITPQTPTSGEYGPTQNHDTLWKIAERLGHERGVPTRKMLDALYQANPQAFNNANMDALKVGAVLKIPESSAILQGAAVQERGETKTPAQKETVKSTVSNKALELVAPAESKIAENTVVGSQAKSGADTGGAPAASPGDNATGGKDIEMQSRIEKLEQQLGMMQQLLTLKDQQLAAIQNQGKTPVPVEPVKPAPTETVTPAANQQPAVTETPPAPAPVTPAPTTPEQKPAVTPQVEPKPKPPRPVPVAPTSEADDSSLYTYTVGGLGVSILGALGWLWWRKRRIEEQTNTESMFASASQIKMPDADSTLSVPVMEMSNASAYDVGTVGESSFISDFTPSDFDAFDTDQSEVDPMSESDVYLAYGRYQQAEDLIRNAIHEQPERDDYKLKLLEILYANESKERFVAYAQDLANAGKQTDRPFWSKVTDMGKELVPESVLFGGTLSTAEVHAPSAETSQPSAKETKVESAPANFELESDTFSLNDDLTGLDSSALPDMGLMNDINTELAELQAAQGDNAHTSAADDNSLDFDLGSFSSPKTSEEQAPATDIESIDFDLNSLSLDTSSDGKNAVSTDKATETLESFNLDFDTIASQDAASKNEQPLDMATLESFEFPDFEPRKEEIKAPEAQPSPEPALESFDAGSDNDDFDFNFDFEVPNSNIDDDQVDLGANVSDLTDMDEFETKIDLAKAYIDMGDSETAKSIAEEVVQKGSQKQKEMAQAILDELK